MDLTNRVLAIGLALIWIFLVLLVILLAWGAPDESINRIADLAGYLEDHNTTGAKLIITFGGLILVMLALILIVVEVAPPDGDTVKVGRVGSGDVTIGTDEITKRVEQELRQMPQIAEAQATVRGRGRKAQIDLDLVVSPMADLASAADEACRTARELVEGRMSVDIEGQPRAKVRYHELRVGGQEGAPAAPQTPEPEAREAPQQPTSHDVPENASAADDRPAGG